MAASWSCPRCSGSSRFSRSCVPTAPTAGPVFHDGLTNALPGLVTEIVRRCDQAKGFVVLPKRWIVERTFGWLNRCRRLAKDVEHRIRTHFAFVQIAMIRIMMRRIARHSVQ